MKIAVMQPTYLPWIGYFDLIDQSDTFVFLDDVQFEKQSWQQRNRIKTPQGWQWLTVPVRQRFPQMISEVEINSSLNWPEKHWKSIAQNYTKATHWNSVSDFLEKFYKQDWFYLADFTTKLICEISQQLSIETRIVRSSTLNIEGDRIDRLINICQCLKADTYLSTPGSSVYLEQGDCFTENRIRLVYHQYEHPVYHQLYGEFLSHMSIVDLLMNEGERAIDIIRSGRKISVSNGA